MLSHMGFLDLGAPELLLILLIVLLLFGGKKLPQLARSLGSSMREVRKGLNDDSGNEKSKKQTQEKRTESV